MTDTTAPQPITMMGRLPKSPYQGKDDRELSRLSSDVTYDDKRMIYSCCAAQGVHNRIVQILYNAVANDCREFIKNNPSATLSERETYLYESLNRRSAAELTASLSNPNESGGTPGVNRNAKGSGDVKAKAGKQTGSRSRREGKKDQGEVGHAEG